MSLLTSTLYSFTVTTASSEECSRSPHGRSTATAPVAYKLFITDIVVGQVSKCTL